MKPDVYSSIDTLAARYGVEAAAEVAALEARHVSVIQSLIDQEQIPCDFEVSKAIDVQLDEGHNAKLLAGYGALIDGGSEATKAAVYVPGSEAETVSSSWMLTILGPDPFPSLTFSHCSSLESEELKELSLIRPDASGRTSLSRISWHAPSLEALICRQTLLSCACLKPAMQTDVGLLTPLVVQ